MSENGITEPCRWLGPFGARCGLRYAHEMHYLRPGSPPAKPAPDRAADVIARWMAHPYEPEQWQLDNARGVVLALAADGLTFVDLSAKATP